MKTLKIFILSLFAIFAFSYYQVHASSQYFYNPNCNEIDTCPIHLYGLSLGIGQMAPLSPEQEKGFLDGICKAKLRNDDAISVNHSMKRSGDVIVYFLDYNDESSFSYANNGAIIDFIECNISDTPIPPLPPPPPKIPGCTNPDAINYNPNATQDNGTCKEKIEGCTDSTAINYNPSANVHKESVCQYPPTYAPKDITGAFEKSQVSIGATTWTVRFNLSVTGAILDPSTIQTWNHFTPVSATTSDKTITVTLRQFDDQRLNVECTNYEITIPKNAITTTNGDTNPNSISGNFEVVGCGNGLNGSGSLNVNIGSGSLDVNPNPKHENTIKENNFYLSLYDTDEKGKLYLNLTNIAYFVGFISFFIVVFFVLFGFIKNSFLGKRKR